MEKLESEKLESEKLESEKLESEKLESEKLESEKVEKGGVVNSVLLGDANKLIKELGDSSIDCIMTDIPYLYNNGGGGSSDVAKRIRANADRLAEAGIDKGISYDIFHDFVRVMKKVNCFIWCSKLQIFDIANWFLNWAKQNGKELFYEILVWTKSNPTPATNNTWLPDVEYCLYFRETGVKYNQGYDYKHKFYNSGLNVLDKNDYGHPTCKPLEYAKKCLLHVTQPGDIVLDPFLGSGTFAVAAKETGRKYIGFELLEEYYNIACDRLSGWNQRGEMNLLDFGDFGEFENEPVATCLEQLDLFGDE